MKKLALTCWFLLCLLSVIYAQEFTKTEFGMKLNSNSVAIEVQFYSPTIVRILKSPQGNTFSKESLSVIKKPETVQLNIKQRAEWISINSSKLKVVVNSKSGAIAFTTLAGVDLLSENEAGFTDFNDIGTKTYTVSQSFMLKKDETIYGLGQQQRSQLSLRNVKLHMVQGNTDDYVPFMVSTKGYGLFWDNYSPTVFEDKPESTSFTSEIGDCIDYYFMLGGNIDGSIA